MEEREAYGESEAAATRKCETRQRSGERTRSKVLEMGVSDDLRTF